MSNGDPKKDNNDIRTGYQVAANLYMQENAIIWSRFSIMVTANSIIVAAIGGTAGSIRPLRVMAIILPIAGAILCLIWWEMTKRGFKYHEIWRKAAGELEAKVCNDVKPIGRADQFRGSSPSRALNYACLVICLFISIYIVSFVQLVFRFTGVGKAIEAMFFT